MDKPPVNESNDKLTPDQILKKIRDEKMTPEQILKTFGREDWFAKWENLKKQLDKDPNNESAKKELKDLLLPDYEKLMQEGQYMYAAQRAESLFKNNVEGGRELLEKSLITDYNNLVNKGMNYYAVQRAQKLMDIGYEGADKLLETAKENISGKELAEQRLVQNLLNQIHESEKNEWPDVIGEK